MIDGDADGSTSGSLILTTPVAIGGTQPSVLSAGGKLTLGAKTGGASYSGSGNLKLTGNSGVHITSDLGTTVNGLEIHIDADVDRTGDGTLYESNYT